MNMQEVLAYPMAMEETRRLGRRSYTPTINASLTESTITAGFVDAKRSVARMARTRTVVCIS